MKRSSLVTYSILAIAMLFCTHARAEIRLPKLISDHAVLQRGVPIRVWGWATPGSQLIINLHGQKLAATADELGEWTCWLSPEAAGGPYILTVKGDGNDTKEVQDILIGDVWFASGQSNMEMPLNGFPPSATVKNAAAEIKAATNPNLRLLLIDHRSSDFPLADISSTWTLCTPETAANFSAIAYFFGRAIAADQHVPLGLIDSTWGGTPADSWVSMNALGTNPALLPAFASRARFTAPLAQQGEQEAAEKREDEQAKAVGKSAPHHPWHPDQTSWQPAGLFNGMVAPITKYSIKGFLWYQGETNSAPDRAPYYAALFKALIQDWRSHFAQGDLPFLYAQISSFNSPGENWGLVRDAQRRALALRDTAMAVTLDVGDPDNVHPADKQTVAARLALGARALVYGESVQYASPLFRQATTEATGMRVWFDNSKGLSAHGKTIEGFELAGQDHHFAPADAVIDGETVVVKSSHTASPRYVRYGWQGVVTSSLYNDAALPASTFSSEPD